jgi:hypothetical protein
MKEAVMKSALTRVLGPADGKAGFLGSIAVRFMLNGDATGGGFSLVEQPHVSARPGRSDAPSSPGRRVQLT